MTPELSIFAARLREHIGFCAEEFSQPVTVKDPAWIQHADAEFNALAIMLFTLQFVHNEPYRIICRARAVTPDTVTHWTQIPAVPTTAFKELALTSLPTGQRSHVFHSSGTTEQRPSRHFHNAESLALYEASLWPWLEENLQLTNCDGRLVCLTPSADRTPHSSLVHMFDFVRRKFGAAENVFSGQVDADGAWTLNVDAAINALTEHKDQPKLVLGTAFSFVHLLDAMTKIHLHLNLPAHTRVLETGGYKGRSRSLPRDALHRLITERLGVPPENIHCEYGMSELSSQAYDQPRLGTTRVFQFPPWARARVISPESSREVAEGETGLLQVFDLANVFSVMAIQTEDLAVRRGAGFELLGRAPAVEPRGCSLMTA